MPLATTEDLQKELAQLQARVDAYLGVDALGSILEQAIELRKNWTRDKHLALLGRLKFDEMQHVQVKRRMGHIERELQGREADMT